MEGAAIRERNALNAGLFTAWHTALFALNGYANKGKLAGNKSLADIMLTGDDRPAPSNAMAHAFFSRLKAQGFPVEITHH